MSNAPEGQRGEDKPWWAPPPSAHRLVGRGPSGNYYRRDSRGQQAHLRLGSGVRTKEPGV